MWVCNFRTVSLCGSIDIGLVPVSAEHRVTFIFRSRPFLIIEIMLDLLSWFTDIHSAVVISADYIGLTIYTPCLLSVTIAKAVFKVVWVFQHEEGVVFCIAVIKLFFRRNSSFLFDE